jgi:heat shock protein HslJ
MNKHLFLVVVTALVAMSSCTDSTLNIPMPRSIANVAVDYKNVPMELLSFARDTGTVSRAGHKKFFLHVNGGDFLGTDGCNNFWAPYRSAGDSITIEGVSSTLIACRPDPDPEGSDLRGTWKVTTEIGRLLLAGPNGQFEFDCTYSAALDRSPLVRGHWLLAASDDTLFAALAAESAFPRLELRADRTINLWWNPGCDWSATGYKGYCGNYGVNYGSGILMRNMGQVGCGWSSEGSDLVLYPFVDAFYACSRYSASDSVATFFNTSRQTYYRFVAVH